MNPQSRPASRRNPASPRRADRAIAADEPEPTADLPTLAHILARYREHGTLARSVAAWDAGESRSLPAYVPALQALASAKPEPRPGPRQSNQAITGPHTRELDNELFDQFFGPDPPQPPAPR